MLSMTVPMVLTLARIVLAPVFFLLFSLAGSGSVGLLAGVWAVLIVMEVSDALDGHMASRLGQVSELGKVLDPFADSISRLTYFVAFVVAGVMPAWVLIILIYRDVAVAYIRVLIAREKVLLPARASGKLKAWVYAVAGFVGTAVFTLKTTGWLSPVLGPLRTISLALFILCAAVAIWSLADYGAFFVKKFRKAS
jgi:CDP-diacylglycerol---glycerol-3-phosphate 3-phosphatidyltransferase